MIGDLAHILLLTACLVVCFRYARRTEDNLYLIFTAFAYAAALLSDVYYLAHTLLREGMRVPFAANDIADFGLFLMLSVALCSAVGLKRGMLRGVTAAAAVFSLANIALWIGWSGEWVRDIFGGAPFGAFVCVCFCSLYLTNAVSRGERAALWALCAVIVAVETAVFFLPASWKAPVETVGYLLMGAVELWFVVRGVLALRPGRSADAAVSLGFAGYMWISVSMYMADGIPYDIFANLSTPHLLLLLLAIRKKVRQA